ncbi:MAG: Asp-tRNA(Asn)/Glu-tRNA(Gln) amidotransferase subunit GatB [Acidimicrobiales bacterium]
MLRAALPPWESLVSAWETVIGLEVHCELSTATKLFCGCPNAFGDEPNTNVCPVCLGLPGSLPVLNEQAVDLAMRIGTALNCEIRPSSFHRKNYFYPDMPKDYQISQYDLPLNVDGWLELPGGQRVGIERAHMEEDTGKTTHQGATGRIHDADSSLVDYNRAGVPLVEIVSRPDMRSADEARAYVTELRSVLVATGASDGKMEEGSLRVDANVSVRPSGSETFGTRCEIKNLNSLRSLGRAIAYEAERQIALIEAGEKVAQQTRHWNEDQGRTGAMRSKEESHDYRYFPEPDLVPVEPDPVWIEGVRTGLPPMPAARAALAELCGVEVSSQQVVTAVELELDRLVEVSISGGADRKIALSRAANEAAARPDEARRLEPASFAALVFLESGGKLTATQAKAVLSDMLDAVAMSPGDHVAVDPAALAKRRGFEAMATGDLAAVVEGIIDASPSEWQRYLEGDVKVTQFFIGQVMKATQGKADGKAVAALLAERKG